MEWEDGRSLFWYFEESEWFLFKVQEKGRILMVLWLNK
jgi:hypothetical protein